jgi:hypothetical protein
MAFTTRSGPFGAGALRVGAVAISLSAKITFCYHQIASVASLHRTPSRCLSHEVRSSSGNDNMVSKTL